MGITFTEPTKNNNVKRRKLNRNEKTENKVIIRERLRRFEPGRRGLFEWLIKKANSHCCLPRMALTELQGLAR
jgi:hypothetical protein